MKLAQGEADAPLTREAKATLGAWIGEVIPLVPLARSGGRGRGGHGSVGQPLTPTPLPRGGGFENGHGFVFASFAHQLLRLADDLLFHPGAHFAGWP